MAPKILRRVSDGLLFRVTSVSTSLPAKVEFTANETLLITDPIGNGPPNRNFWCIDPVGNEILVHESHIPDEFVMVGADFSDEEPG